MADDKQKKKMMMPASFLRRRPSSALPVGAEVHARRTGGKSPQKQPRRSLLSWVPKTKFPKRPVTRNLWLFIWIVVVVLAAQVALYVQPKVGIYINVCALASLLGLALTQRRAQQLLVSVAIIPLTMLVGLSLPPSTVFLRTMELSLVVLLLGLVYQYLFTLDFPVEGTRFGLGWKGILIALPLMVLLGSLLGLAGFGFLHNQYDFWGTPKVLVAVGIIIFAVSEEVLFRGLIQQRAMMLFHPVMGTILAAILYTSVTLGHRGGTLALLVGLLVGLTTSLVYYRRQNILLTITINAAAKLTYCALVMVFVLK